MQQLWGDPENWIDLIDHAWYGLVLILVAAIPAFFAHRNGREIKRVGKQTEAVMGQVVNGHAETNLRNDLDKVIDGLEELSNHVRSLREDLMVEEDRRRAQILDLRDELDRRTGHRRHQI